MRAHQIIPGKHLLNILKLFFYILTDSLSIVIRRSMSTTLFLNEYYSDLIQFLLLGALLDLII